MRKGWVNGLIIEIKANVPWICGMENRENKNGKETEIQSLRYVYFKMEWFQVIQFEPYPHCDKDWSWILSIIDVY